MPIPKREQEIKNQIQELQKVVYSTRNDLDEIQSGEDLAEQITQKLKESGALNPGDAGKGK